MGWVLPTGYDDPDSKYVNETTAYDNDLNTFSYHDVVAPGVWGSYLIVTHASMLSNQLRFKCWVHLGSQPGTVDIDIYHDGAWYNVYEGVYDVGGYNVKQLGGIYNVTKIRIRVRNNDSVDRGLAIHEVQFYEAVAATVTTQAVDQIDEDSGRGNGNITNIGSANPTKRGFCWNTSGSPTVADDTVEEEGSFGTGAFTGSISGLDPGVQYYVKAYAYNEAGYAYGGEVNFTTDKVAPTVTTQAPTSVLPTSITGNGNITATGGENSTVRGFKYGLTQDDTWDAHDDGSFGAGAFTKAISSNLLANTTYWIRAYATNTIGTSYGAWVQFQTAAIGAIPTGTMIVICSDYTGYTYKAQGSETDDGEAYTGHFTINTDLAKKQGLTTYKRILDLHLYFRCEASGTAEVYAKRDSEASFQYLGSVGLTDVTEPAIIVKHLAIDIRAKDYDFKVSFGNACRFLGVVFEFIPEGDR